MRCPACKDLIELQDVRFCPTCGAPLLVEYKDPLLGQVVGGRYKIHQLIAEGGMGRVYLGEQDLGGVKRKVAIKVLMWDVSAREQDTKRFERECQTVAELEHPNTIKFYDFGRTDDGDLFIAMEYLSGPSLAQVLKSGPLFPERVDLIVGQICGSLQEAHDHGIIHRDLKPDNIILTSPGGAPDFVKVLDFGIAKRTNGRDPKLTPLGVVLGSPPYMSPEQFTLQDVDAKSDVYALGVVAYQLLTGHLPFQAHDPIEWAALHMGATPAPIDSHGVAIPPTMAAAIHRALAKHAHERPSSMREFYSQLTIGAGSLIPGRASSMLPLTPSQIPLPPRNPKLAATGDSWPSPRPREDLLRPAERRTPPNAVTRDAPAASADGAAPHAGPDSGEAGTRVRPPDSDDAGTRVRPPTENAPWPDHAMDEGPVTEVRAPRSADTMDVPQLYSTDSHPELGVSVASSAPYASGPSVSAHEISSPTPSLLALQEAESTSSGTRALRAKKGTLVMAASEPPPARARMTMPDLLPPTVRDPGALLAHARRSRSILWVALALVLVGAAASGVAWFFFLRPQQRTDKRPKPVATATVGGELSAETGAPTGTAPTRSAASVPGPAPQPSPSAPAAPSSSPATEPEPSPGKERMSPCQTAIFSAVSGNCELARRAFSRCEDTSPYRASAERAVSGLCP
jgi:serine/threonine protein kinase